MNSEPIASPARNPPRERVREGLLGFAVVMVWITVWLCIKPIYGAVENSLDSAGWLEHSHDTPVWIEGDWLDGEFRVCAMLPGKTISSFRLLCGHSGYKYPADSRAWLSDILPAIQTHDPARIMDSFWKDWTSAESIFHVLPVKYWGRIDHRYPEISSWRCQRKSGEMECRAIN